MNNILKEICEYKKNLVIENRSLFSENHLLEQINRINSPISFINALKKSTVNGYGLIAEIKSYSPSGGMIRKNFNPKKIANDYLEAGAACLSILTDEKYFKGKNSDLSTVKNTVNIPCLRKDFIIDPYQVVESRSIGSDAILLILAAVDDKLASDIENAAIELQMDVLIEVHTKNEIERALKLKSNLIGINNRNLKTLVTDIETSINLSKFIPNEYTIISESGLKTSNDLYRLSKNNIKCFLIGESLLRCNDIKTATKNLLSINY
ncbi:indole-3-glycerol phosphate synthase TrpC [Alphaproteobacteria bacterium]|nr:indole-3-glycerol phosphate synthase TrpC [Alphaproteobacteria bacterium]